MKIREIPPMELEEQLLGVERALENTEELLANAKDQAEAEKFANIRDCLEISLEELHFAIEARNFEIDNPPGVRNNYKRR